MKTLALLLLLLPLGCSDRRDSTAADLGSPPDLAHGGLICTAIGCGPSLLLRSTTLALTAAQIQASSIAVCRNQECFSTTFASWQAPTVAGAGTSTDFPDVAQRDTTHTPLITAIWWYETNGFRLDLEYIPWQTSDLHDGDVFDVTLTAGDGSKTLESHKTVTYTVSYPNGPDCGPECRSTSDHAF
jgi:hypothetical protein